MSTGADAWVARPSRGRHSPTMPRPEVLATVNSLCRAFGDSTFTTGDASRAGVAQHRLGSAVRSGVVHRLAPGRYRVAGEQVGTSLDLGGLTSLEAARVRDRIAQYAERGVTALLGSQSAAQAWGLPMYQLEAPDHPVLLVPRRSSLKPGVRRGIRTSLRDVDPQHVVRGPGAIPMTDPLLTALHVAAGPRLTLPGRLVVLHGGLRRHWELLEGGEARMTSRGLASAMSDIRVRTALLEEMAEVAAGADIDGCGGLRGPGAAAASAWARLESAMRIADPRIETALESLSWAQFAESGLSMPLPQANLRGASGVLWRVDFLFEGRVIGECDGAVKYRAGHTLWQEKRRQSDLEAKGYDVVRWTWEEILRDPKAVLGRIDLALRRAR